MFGLTAAPEIAIAVPSEMPPFPGSPYSFVFRYPRVAHPQNCGVITNDSAFRCCHARFAVAARFNAAFITRNGRQSLSSGARLSHRWYILKLSFGSKSVNASTLRGG